MRNNLADILASCLEAVEQGERTAEECLALYPEYRTDLESLLNTTAVLWEHTDFTPRPGFGPASRARLVQRLSPPSPPASKRSSPRAEHKARPFFSRRLAMQWTVFLLLVISLVGSGTVYASDQALPGDVLYPLKLSIEDARLWISDDAEDVALATRFTQTRIEEIQALIEASREEDLQLAVDLLSSRITMATGALEIIAHDEPERAAQLASLLEQVLVTDSEVLSTQLETVPDRARPAIQRAILASNRGKQVVQDFILNEQSGVGPPDELPGPVSTQPAGQPQKTPRPGKTRPAGGPEPASTQPAHGPPGGKGGPPSDVPGGRP